MVKLPANFDVTPLDDAIVVENGTTLSKAEHEGLKTLGFKDKYIQDVQHPSGTGIVYEGHVVYLKPKKNIPPDFDFSVFPYLVELIILGKVKEPVFHASIGKLYHLRNLQFYHHECDAFPENLRLSPNLEKLDLERLNVKEIPPILSNPNNIKRLGFWSMPSLDTFPAWITDCVNLRVLTIRKTGISEFPESLQSLQELGSVALSDSPLRVVPRFLSKLPRLNSLSLVKTEIEVLPDWIGNLRDLKGISIADNKITHLPDSIGNLSALKRLRMDRNRLVEIPDGIGGCVNLDELYARNNDIKQISPEIGNCKKLSCIDLEGNQLHELPETFGNLVSLKTLDLSRNKLKTLPDSFGNLTSLTSLDLSHNQLKDLPESIGNLPDNLIITLGFNPLPDMLWNILDESPGRFKIMEGIREYLKVRSGDRQNH